MQPSMFLLASSISVTFARQNLCRGLIWKTSHPLNARKYHWVVTKCQFLCHSMLPTLSLNFGDKRAAGPHQTPQLQGLCSPTWVQLSSRVEKPRPAHLWTMSGKARKQTPKNNHLTNMNKPYYGPKINGRNHLPNVLFFFLWRKNTWRVVFLRAVRQRMARPSRAWALHPWESCGLIWSCDLAMPLRCHWWQWIHSFSGAKNWLVVWNMAFMTFHINWE